jgi:hypothetical protein
MRKGWKSGCRRTDRDRTWGSRVNRAALTASPSCSCTGSPSHVHTSALTLLFKELVSSSSLVLLGSTPSRDGRRENSFAEREQLTDVPRTRQTWGRNPEEADEGALYKEPPVLQEHQDPEHIPNPGCPLERGHDAFRVVDQVASSMECLSMLLSSARSKTSWMMCAYADSIHCCAVMVPAFSRHG